MKVTLLPFSGRVSLETDDKYAKGVSVPVDCASKIHLCKAACCKLSIYLSAQDVAEGVADYDKDNPYHLKKRADHSCVHQNCETRACEIHENRPGVCMIYDCRNDRRIWFDFDMGMVNPAVHKPGWPKTIK